MIDLDASIDALELPVRLIKPLKRARIETVQQLTECTLENLYDIRNIGFKSTEMIEIVLTYHRLKLKDA